ncbi:RDD family protein [Aliirhizobium terrae]|uniref:RDD family protein n=1 Tax=Terrirhizobium terrae TaxID=2926709 RepID=UPI0025762C7A|nr:RDD family protein [Rhizobium sp. CC-CFT758]WJH41233.1 RDD family protein [Rhizobium sp. CC-CFT758]
MTDWYYAVGQGQQGPVGDDELRSLIKSGAIKRDTYVWRDGMENWLHAEDHPDLAKAFVTPPPLPLIQPPKLPPPAFQPVAQQPAIVLISRPWPRFWARFIDNLIFVPLLGFGIGLWSVLYAPDIYLQLMTMNAVVFGILVLPLAMLMTALCMILTGYTPGKAIVGVKVPVADGRNRIAFFLGREMRVWVAGLGLGIPFVALFTQVRQYRRLAAGKAATYDEGAPVVTASPSKMRLGLAIVIVSALFAGNIVLRMDEQQSSRNLTTSKTWVNPVTNKPASIGRTWQPEEMATNSGRAFYFASNELLAEAIFGYEQFPTAGVDAAAYARAIKDAVASDVAITSEWQPTYVQRMPALRATGRAIKANDSVVEVTIVVSGRNAWRTLVFTRGNSPAQAAEKDRFVQAMFATAN